MTNASLSPGFPLAALRRLAAGLVLAAAVAGLSSCTAYDEVFGEEPVPGIVTTGSGSQQDAVVPSLASVPDRPTPSSAAQRQALQESLRQDRGQAVYSDQPAVRGETRSPEATAEDITGEVERPMLSEAPAEPAPSGYAPLPEPSAGRSGTPGASLPAPPGDRRQPEPAREATPPVAVGPAQIQQYNLPQRPSYSELVGVIFFAYGSASLDQRDQGVLRQIVQLQQQRGGQLRVVGHASLRTEVANPVEHNLANFNMSLQRAQAVSRRLEALGGSPVVVEAMGSAQPVYYEFMPTGEAGNRRAEIFLDY